MSGEDISLLKNVPSPDDDDSQRSEQAIQIVWRRNESKLLQLASELDFGVNQENTPRRVLSHCYRECHYAWFLLGLLPDTTLEDMGDCIKQMQSLRKGSFIELTNFQTFSAQMGLEYMREYLNLDI